MKESPDRMPIQETVESIAKRELGCVPDRIEAIADRGVVNMVFKVIADARPYIFRLNNEQSLRSYQKEKWCMEKAAEKGVPVSVCRGLGVEGDHSYMILDYIEGVDGADLPDEHERIYEALGKYAKIINSIPVGGYGENIEDPQVGFADDWKGVVDWLVRDTVSDDFLVEHSVLTPDQFARFKKRLEELYEWEFTPMLCHGNLGVKNTVVSPDGTINIIDWGNGAGQRAPHFDVAEIMTWGTTDEQVDIFTRAYGIAPEELEEMRHDINTLIMLRLLSSMKWRIREGKKFGSPNDVRDAVERMEGMV